MLVLLPSRYAGQGASNQCPAVRTALPAPPNPCPAGTYSNDLLATTRAADSFALGYFCPAGTASFAMNLPSLYCPPGTGSD